MPQEQINCLRCHHCALQPDTDFSNPTTAIYCGKKKEVIPIILSGCGLAKPQFQKIRRRGMNGRHRENIGGDKTRQASPVELAFLRYCYAHDVTMDHMTRRTGRNANTIAGMARTHGFHRPRRHLMGAVANGLGKPFTPAQTRFLLAAQKSELWPKMVNDRWFPENTRRRAHILQRVAELGPPHSWSTICKHLTLQSPAYQKRKCKPDQRRRGEFLPGATPLRWQNKEAHQTQERMAA